jgi:hypothetical protein
MNIYLKISIKLISLFLLLLLVNQVYKITFWPKDISKHADVLENLWNVPADADAIYFGESSNFHVPEGDTVKHRISEILDGMLTDTKLATVDNAGLHAGTYKALMDNLPKSMHLKFVIITMNYRSFGAAWRYADFENYLAKTSLMLEPCLPVVNKFRVSLRDYDNQTNAYRQQQIRDAWRNETFEVPGLSYNNVIAWDSAMAWGAFKASNALLNDTTIPLACHYIKNFAFTLDTINNERINDLDRLVEIARKRNIKVVFNLLSENMQQANDLVGPMLTNMMEDNCQLLIDRYTQKGALVINNLYVVPDSCFVDRNWPTEHYNLAGKELVAQALAKGLKKEGLANNTLY